MLVSTVQQRESDVYTHTHTHTHTHILFFLDFLPIEVTTEHCVEFPVPYTRFSLVIYYIIYSNNILYYI